MPKHTTYAIEYYSPVMSAWLRDTFTTPFEQFDVAKTVAKQKTRQTSFHHRVIRRETITTECEVFSTKGD